MTVDEIVRLVRSAIDEQVQTGVDFAHMSEDNQSLTQLIKDKIVIAMQYVLEHVPEEMLDESTFQTQDTIPQTDFTIDQETLVGKLKLPDGLLRITTARLSSWPYFPLPEPSFSQVALMQQDKYARGSWDRPVNILSAGYLEMYCAKTTADTLIFRYIKKPAINTTVTPQTVDIPAKLEGALIYHIAGLVMTGFREDVAKNMFDIAAGYMRAKVSE